MSRWIPPLLLLGALVGTFAFFQQRSSTGRAGFPAPDFALRDLQGRTVRLSDYRGKIVFLNLWATWCPPCREEMPSMERLSRKLQGRDFVMLAVSEDEDPSTVRGFVEQMKLSFPVLLDSQGTLPSRYGVTGYPETFVIDRGGSVIQHVIGPEDWDSQAALQYFTKLLEPAAPSNNPQRAGAD